MSDEAERWREKYLKGIEQQDKLEKRWNARLDLLRRGLVRSSLAAEGSDRAVDQCMKEMREIVRKDDMDAGLAALIPKLEKAVLDSEQRREVRAGQISSALVSLVSQLQSLDLPKDVRKPLKRFAKDLEERAAQARELPLLLGELSGLQGRALTQIEKPEEQTRPGLLARLFGGHEANPAGAEPGDSAAPVATPTLEPAPRDADADDWEEPDASPTAVPASTQPAGTSTGRYEPLTAAEPTAVAPQHVPLVQAPAKPAEAVKLAAVEADAKVDAFPVSESTPELEPVAERIASPELQPEPASTQDLLTPTPVVPFEHSSEAASEGLDEGAPEQSEEAAPFSLPSSPEPSYSSVAAHIEETLLGLLNDLTLPEHHRPQAEAMRTRLEHGLNWYELLPILEDLAVLMLAISDGGQQDFESYLKQLNERLESFQSNLQAASDDYVGQQSESRELNNQLREQVDGLQSSVQDAADLNSLKQVLESRLEGLLSTMDQHQVARDEREKDVAARLQSLASRVATMEQEALGFRANIEEQRQKALIDPLTSLPNRAAWEERLGQEVALWQRDKNSLLVGILDLDHFKRINDGFGHLAGDRVLKIVAKVLKKHLRGGDFIARFGGEEFVLLMPATQVSAGLALLDQLRSAVELCPFHFKSEPVVITVSIGVTALRPGERSDVALKRADQALYRAKENGRNQVEQG